MMNSNSSSSSSDPNSEEVILLASSRPKKRAGRKKFKETRHPVYRGVRRRNNNKWVCELRQPNTQKRIWLGTYRTPEMAARAHDVAALALRGNLATLNFADSVWCLPVPLSKDPKDICQAAAKAAQAFLHDSKLVGVDYMNDDVSSSTSEEVKSQERVVGGTKEMQEMEMESISCCKWGENTEMLEIEGSSWQEKMAEELLFSPTPRLGSRFCWDDVEISDVVDVSLWTYCD